MKIHILLIALLTSTLYSADYTRKKPHEIISLQAANSNNIRPQKVVIVQAGKQYGILPQQIADMSAYLRNRFIKYDVACLDLLDRSDKRSVFDLDIIIPLLWQARRTLTEKPTSPKGSYVELANKDPLASLTDYKKLVRLFVACDALGLECHRTPGDEQYETAINAAICALALADEPSERFNRIVKKISGNTHYDDQPVLKAIALRIEQLGLEDPFYELDYYCTKINYNFKQFIWPHIQAQCLLNSKCKYAYTDYIPFGISIHDLMVHDVLDSKITNMIIGIAHFNYQLNLSNSRLNSLDGIGDITTWVSNFVWLRNKILLKDIYPPNRWNALWLSDNEFTTIPQVYLPKLQTLDLANNKISTLPDNLDNFPSLKSLNLKGNSITHIPEKLKREGLTIYWDGQQ